MSAGSVSTRASRQAAKKASTKFEAQLMSSPVKGDDKITPVKPAGKAANRTRSRPNLKKDSQGASSKRSVGLSKSAPPRTGSRKRPISLDSHRSDDQESDLTSLSTPRASPSPRSKPIPAKLPPVASLEPESHVWVLVDFNGAAFRLQDEDDGVERIWWPGQILPLKNSEFRVRLFGTLRASNVVTVDTPHDGNILPLAASDKIRFTKPSYAVSSLNHDTASPKKRQKLDRADLEAKWMAALSEAVYHYEQDEVPSLGFLSSVRNVPKYASSSHVKLGLEDKSSELPAEVIPPRWSPPPPDMSLQIPGEMILAREKKTSKLHWPAKIQAYIPPEDCSTPLLYRIQWMDNTTADIPRDFFYALEDDGFGTCVLGKFESSFEEVVNDTDEPDAPERLRGPSPEPRDPPPSMEEFCDLSVRKQFVYTKPVLQAILREEYPPARALHDQFIAGGKSRSVVVRDASLRGMMDPRDVEEFQRYVVEWCLRDTAKREDPDGAGDGEATERTDISGGGTTGETNDDEAVAVVDVPEKPKSLTLDSKLIDERLRDVEVSDEDPALQESLCNPPSPTPTRLDGAPSSPPLPPPSSSFSSTHSDIDVLMEVEETDVQDKPAHRHDGADIGDAFDTSSVLSDASDVSALVETEKPPRQAGCQAYEGLKTVEKLDYCLNVLLPELVIQIILWRLGKRTSLALLSPEEEAELHELGAQERRKTDWVFDVRRLREKKEVELRNRETVVGGTTSRPKKALRR